MINKLEDVLEFNNSTDIIAAMLQKAKKSNNIVIFGAGIGGRLTGEILKKNGLFDKVICFSDNSTSKWNTDFYDRRVLPPTDLSSVVDDSSLVLISSTAFDSISEQLVNYGIKRDALYYFQLAGLSIDNEDKDYIQQNLDKFSYVYNMLKDNKSKDIFSDILNYRINKDDCYLKHMMMNVDLESYQYFDLDLWKKYCIDDGFVDAGAYIGDTLVQLSEKIPDFNGKYYAFEAEKDVYNRLKSTIGTSNIAFETVLYNLALWSCKGTINFSTTENDAGSRVSEDGNCVECNTIDDLLIDERIDFIKMDIEGAEHAAIVGATNVIRKWHPALAVCIYHKKEDFFDIPILIESILQDEYEYYIRQYRYGQSETVLYAMPKSKRRQ